MLQPRASRSIRAAVLASIALFLVSCWAAAAEPALIGHWPLAEGGKDVSGGGLDAENVGVKFSRSGSEVSSATAEFDGAGAHFKVPHHARLNTGEGEFTIGLRLHTDRVLNDDPGDLASRFDAAARRGFQLALRTQSTTSSAANVRQLQFGIDAGSEPTWRDEGRPGQALVGFALCVHNGRLYVASCEPGKEQAGRVYRYEGPGRWKDLGSLDGSNSVICLASFGGELYAGTGKYRLGGSALAESENTTLGGRIFRLSDSDSWEPCGQLPDCEAVQCFAVYNNRLYASSLFKPPGFFRYEGGGNWTRLPVPDEKRVEALAVYDGSIYATCYDHGHVYRFDGELWTDLGQVGAAEENTQTYSLCKYSGALHVALWRSGSVARLTRAGGWENVGRLGEELEVMGLLPYNGKLYGGTLPTGNVYRYDESSWTQVARLDHTPDVKYRRVWTMAEYQGRLFCTTLPSGHIHSMQVGATVSHDLELASGWRHIAAVRAADRLKLYVDGKLVASGASFDSSKMNLDTTLPLLLGAGPVESFHGRMKDVRLYRGALSDEDVAKLAAAAK